MGCCQSVDALPEVPDVILPDPEGGSVVECTVLQLSERDHAICKVPSQPRKDMVKWLWFNKSDGMVAGTGIIELENFVRDNIDDEDKGRVLWRAEITERPQYKQFTRTPYKGAAFYTGGFVNTPAFPDEDDSRYIHHPSTSQSDSELPTLVTRWSTNTKAIITPGNTGRGKVFGDQPIHLDVYASGGAVTGWKWHERQREINGEMQTEKVDQRFSHEFVDRIEFRLIHNEQLLTEWTFMGDTVPIHGSSGGAGSVDFSSPWVTCGLQGGYYYIKTREAVDPALAMLVAHLCATEFSIQELKRDFVPSVPRKPPNERQLLHEYGSSWQEHRSILAYSGVAFNSVYQGGIGLLPVPSFNNSYPSPTLRAPSSFSSYPTAPAPVLPAPSFNNYPVPAQAAVQQAPPLHVVAPTAQVAVGHQYDSGEMKCCIIKCHLGRIPGKMKGFKQAWYTYGGQEYSVENPNEIEEVRGTLLPPPGVVATTSLRPTFAPGQDPQGRLWCAIADTQWGQIPGKVDENGTCYYPYGGQEHVAHSFRYVQT